MTPNLSDIRLGGAAAMVAVLILLCTGCGDAKEPSGDEALKRKLEQQAAARADKASVTFGAIHHHRGGAEPGGPWTVEVQGDETSKEIRIDEAYLVMAAFELHACEPGQDGYKPSGNPELINGLYDLLVPPVSAHVPSSATRLGTPYVEDLLAKPGSAKIIGEIAPPLGRWCRVVPVVAPADSDVMNSTSVRTEEMVGTSLLIRGATRKAGEKDGDWKPFTWKTDARTTVDLQAVDPRSGESPIGLESSGASAMLLVDKSLGPETFGVGEAIETPGPKAAEAILKRLTDTFEIHTFD
jgi:hypothetical protein